MFLEWQSAVLFSLKKGCKPIKKFAVNLSVPLQYTINTILSILLSPHSDVEISETRLESPHLEVIKDLRSSIFVCLVYIVDPYTLWLYIHVSILDGIVSGVLEI